MFCENAAAYPSFQYSLLEGGGGGGKASDRCACTAANPEYEPVTNGWRARRHVANAERLWMGERVGKLFGTRHHYQRGGKNTPLFAPKSISSTRLVVNTWFFFLIRSDFTRLTQYVTFSKRNNRREKDVICALFLTLRNLFLHYLKNVQKR